MARKRQTTGLPKVGEQKQKPASPTPNAAGTTPSSTNNPQAGRRGAPLKEFRSKAEQEAQQQRLIQLGITGAVALVAALLLIAIVFEVFIRPNQAVANVNGENITVSEFQRRVRLEHALLSLEISSQVNQLAAFTGGTNQALEYLSQSPDFTRRYNELQFADTLGLRVLNDMVDDKLVAQAASNLGVTVSDEDVEAKINEFFNYDPEAVAAIGAEPTATPTETITPTPFVSPTPSPVPTNTPAPTATATVEGAATADATAETTFTAVPTEATPTLSATEVQGQQMENREEVFNSIQRVAGVSRDDIYAYFRTQALREKVGESVAASSTTAPFVNARMIQLTTSEEAADVLASLQAGEDFASLASTLSTDQFSRELGGELDWQPLFTYPEAVVSQLSEAEIGALVGPIEIENTFRIYQLRGREERELEEDQVEQRQDEAFENWLTEQREAQVGNFETYSNWTENLPNLTPTLQ